MSESYTLEAQPRAVVGKQVKALRREKLIPAVVYGIGAEPMNIVCNLRPLEILLSKAGTTHLVQLQIEGQTLNTLIRDVQRDSIRRTVMHVDFLQVDLTKTIRTEVQIHLVRLPKLGSDMLIAHNIQSIEVECLPTAIPSVIEADASRLTSFDARLTVADLPQLPNVEYLADATDVIAAVTSLTVTSEEEIPGETTIAEPEVVERGKKEEEDF